MAAPPRRATNVHNSELLQVFRSKSEADRFDATRERLAALTDDAHATFRAHPERLADFLTPGQLKAGSREPWLARANYGHAVEKYVADKVVADADLNLSIDYQPRDPSLEGGRPDFAFRTDDDRYIDVTTGSGVRAHQQRSYGERLTQVTYEGRDVDRHALFVEVVARITGVEPIGRQIDMSHSMVLERAL